MKTKRKMTCIICPRGCELDVSIEDGKVISVKNNFCRRGVNYAENEVTSPMRSVTSTVKSESGRLVSVKTDRAIPKKNIFDCMAIINKITAPDGCMIGDVIAENIFGANIVVTGV